MKNSIAIIREKLELYRRPYIEKELVEKLLSKYAPNYTVSQLCDLWLLSPIKRGKSYFNKKSKGVIHPFVLWDLYMWDNIYMFWWMRIYNKYWLSEQVAESFTIYNTKISGKRKIWPIKYIFVRQRESFFYWIKTEEFESFSYKVMTKERAFIEALKENKVFSKIPNWIDIIKLKNMANKYASKNIIEKINRLCS